MSCPYKRFVITDGTTDTDTGLKHEVSLLGGIRANGLCITDWQMRVAETKGGGVWADSSLAHGRHLKMRKRNNVQETLTLEIEDWNADSLGKDLHLLYDLLEKAANWGPSGWSKEPIWIEAVGVNETNVRYSLIHDYRTPMGGDPFAQPFWQKVLRSGMTSFELVLERESAWRGNYPGDSDCVEISAMQTMTSAYPLVFNGDTSEVDLASPANIDDLAVAASFTVEAWINSAGWGEANLGVICDKSANLTVGWSFYHSNAVGLYGTVFFDVTDAISTSGLDEWTTTEFDEWHHVAMVFSNITKQIRLFIDGTEVSSYATQQAGANNALADAAQTAQIGNTANGTRGWDGEIGWLRISSAALYAANFTPEPRCPIPGFEASTAWLGIHEGTGADIFDLSGAGNDGTANNTSWGDGCQNIYGNYDPVSASRQTSCDTEFVYVANKHNTIGLTHIFVYDGGVYTANLLLGNPPYDLLPAVPAADDRVYFGIQSTLDDAGPFCSLVFDLSQVQTGIAAIVWEYSQGGAAWGVLDVQDNTNNFGIGSGATFDTLGIESVHWRQPDLWVEDTINGVTALWVRAEVQDAGAQPPIQANRHVYTVLWPYLEIQKDELKGNVEALARVYIANQSDGSTSFGDTDLYYNRILCGLRSMDRGDYFSPYLHWSDRVKQNFIELGIPGSIQAFALGVGAFANDVESVTGRVLTITNPAAIAEAGRITMGSDAAAQYQGTFHAYVKAVQTSGSAGDLSLRLRIHEAMSTGVPPSLAEAFFVSDVVPFAYTGDWQLIDFGSVTIDTNYGILTTQGLTISLDASGDGAADATAYELILIPTDQWAMDAIDTYNTLNSQVGERHLSGVLSQFLQQAGLEGISDPRRSHANKINGIYPTYATIYTNWQGRSAEGPILLPDTRQRLWFCSTRYSSLSTAEQRSEPYACGSVQAWAVEQYLMMRGDE